ncbi:MAG: tyrosine-type recombinase/integrase [Burkholderiaceae bacterium]|nr:tyrosine-type recombinase/integrase [Ideonella sp.]MCC7287813.1 tyrosine-type recombinase/integrase [Burkholderiaceae bacterium]
MAHPSRVRVTGPLESFAQGFAAELLRQGYRPKAAVDQVRLLAHLSRWLDSKRLGATDLTTAVLDEFLVARRSQGYVLGLSPKALAPLIGYLRCVGVTVLEPTPTPNATEALLARYRDYLLGTRGLTATSVRGYVDLVRAFVASRVVEDELDWASLRPADVTGFVLIARQNRAIGSAKLLATALRSLLGYVHIEGLIPAPMRDVVPSVAGRRLAGLPRSLEPPDVRRLLASCDRRTGAGRRDFAMLMLLARLGLRAGEVRRLALEDIDWRAGELLVRGKGSCLERLPLPEDVGQALTAYLQRGRPATAQSRTVFVRVRAPHRALSSGGVTQAVAAAAARAGLERVSAHRLRHTVATEMVRAGVPLPAVAQVLRHRRLMTTAIYAKVDRERLRLLARPWPGGTT